MMKKPFFLCPIFFVLTLSSASAGFVKGRYNGSGNKKLFVFGDSYADTGNWDPSVGSSWKPPYGMTFPGKPAGRFSDGQILTDYIASYLNISSPIPYERRNSPVAGPKELQFGMNFAYGGTGVFDTDITQPNMTSQITLFNNIINQGKVYNNTDLQSSVALISLGGNDYANYLKHGPNISLSEFTKNLINQLTLDLEHIHSLGVPKVVVTAMEPFGCLPAITFLFGFKNCSQSLNEAAIFHNNLLQKGLERLNNGTQKPVFFMLDLYNAFLVGLDKTHQIQSGKLGYENILKPCCQGLTNDYDCGSKEGNEVKYSLCENPKLAFFWDKVHPAQNGWYQVYQAIKPSLQNVF